MNCCQDVHGGETHVAAVADSYDKKRKRDEPKFVDCRTHETRIACALANKHTACAVACLLNAPKHQVYKQISRSIVANDLVALDFMLGHLVSRPNFALHLDDSQPSILLQSIMFGSIDMLTLFMKHGANYDALVFGNRHRVLGCPVDCVFPQRVENYKFVLSLCAKTLKTKHKVCHGVLNCWFFERPQVQYESQMLFLDLLVTHVGVDLSQHAVLLANQCILLNSVPMFHKLREYGIDLTAVRDKYQQTMLHFYAYGHSQSLAIPKLLLQLGLDVNVLDDCNRTPLNSAVWRKHINYVQFLLSNGADASLPDKDGQTPITLAMHGKSIDEIVSSPHHKHRLAKMILGGGFTTKAAAL